MDTQAVMNMPMKKLTILGSTGSIGTSTLAVVREHPQQFTVKALVADSNVGAMLQQCREFRPQYVAMANNKAAKELRYRLQQENLPVEVLSGVNAACELVVLDDVDQVMAAIVGVAGLLPTLAAIRAGKQVLLANKEALVTCGKFFMEAVAESQGRLLPIDSEHNAIFQSLPESLRNNLGSGRLSEHGVSRIILTGSGGPLHNLPVEQFDLVTPQQACAHPNWLMGPKISVDSATMMNKGLEYIEAHWMFNASAQELEIIIHPQSVIHSMVRYCDGSVLAQLGVPDMRTPIAYAMAYPERVAVTVDELDFCQLATLTFSQPDFNRYPCLKLAIEACQAGQAATTALNAANEVCVAAFLHQQILFTDIAQIIRRTVENLTLPEPATIEEVLEIDRWARQNAHVFIAKHRDKIGWTVLPN